MASFPTVESLPRPRRLPIVPVLFVATFAFTLASFPARNAELWQHLATGRQIVESRDLAGLVPQFDQQRTPTQTWLFDVAAFAIFSIGGGGVLVFAKAVLAATLAVILVCLSARDGSAWLPVVCTMLVVLAMSMRLLVYPATVSYLLLGFTLWIVHRRHDWTKRTLLPSWQLPLIFVIWANCDSGFVIGLMVVALDGMGRVFEAALGKLDSAPDAVNAREGITAAGCLVRTVCWVLILACASAVNPSHVRAFTSAPELQWLGIGMPVDSESARWSSSPFHGAAWTTFGLTPAGLAYFPLLGLGLLSFCLAPRRDRWRRFLPWLALALLSAVHIRAVPYFAVIAGPVLAWNLHDFFARNRTAAFAGAPGRWERFGGKLLSGAMAGAFLVAAWPGWLQAPPYEPRRWAVETAPGPERAAQLIQQWRQEGKLAPDAHGLHVSAETAWAFAWFCPQTSGRIDPALLAGVLRVSAEPTDWENQLRSAKVNHLVVQANQRQRLEAILERMAEEPRRWPLLSVTGDVAIFGWRDPAKPTQAEPFAGLELSLDQLAFHPALDRRAPRVPAEQAPDPAWSAFWKPRPPRLLELDEASWHLSFAEAHRRWAPYRRVVLLDTALPAGMVGALANWNSLGSLVDLDFRMALTAPAAPRIGLGPDSLPPRERFTFEVNQEIARHRDDAPPASMLLAIRGARRALALDPNHPQAHLVLGEAYLRQLLQTRERARSRRFPQLARLRQVQASAGLNRAIALRPELAPAHLQLGNLYRELGFADLALQHWRIYRDLVERARRQAGLDADEAREERAHFDRVLEQLAKQVAGAGDAFAAESGQLRVLDRARLALGKGLAATARDLLEKSDIALFGAEGMVLQQELQLLTGRPRLVREWTRVEHKNLIGPSTYHWLQTQALAALGDYVAAREQCVQLAAASHPQDAAGTAAALALEVGKYALADQPIMRSLPAALWRGAERPAFGQFVSDRARSLRVQADANVLLGLLALEEGQADDADVAFRLALSIWQDDEAAADGRGLDFGGRRTAQDGIEWLK